MQMQFLLLNILSIFVSLGIAWVCSMNRKEINWRPVLILVPLNALLSFFLVSVPAGRAGVEAAADGFKWLIDTAYSGISFVAGNWVLADPSNTMSGPGGTIPFFFSALMPILLVVPLFDILTYIGVLPFIIKWIGRGLSFITQRPKFESFFSIEMMFLGNTEAIAVSRLQIATMKPKRNLTIAIMSMSCITASILGAYILMMPGEYIITAVPLNILNCIIISSLLNPVDVPKEEDTVAKLGVSEDAIKEASENEGAIDENGEREPFFIFLGNSIMTAMNLIIIIFANVCAFVALVALIDALMSLTGLQWLSLENIFGVILWPFAFLLGFDPGQAFKLATYMGTKLVTNEFVVMGKVGRGGDNSIFEAAPHFRAVLTVFLTSFANFSTIGMVTGVFKGIAKKDSNELIAKNVPRLFLSGVLVSLLSAALVGIFVW